MMRLCLLLALVIGGPRFAVAEDTAPNSPVVECAAALFALGVAAAMVAGMGMLNPDNAATAHKVFAASGAFFLASGSLTGFAEWRLRRHRLHELPPEGEN